MSRQKLLTIAIPTFNRGKILDQSFGKLLRQVSSLNSDEIEIIISDNCSTDGTKSVIKKYSSLFPDLNITSNFQEYNTGYFGNFKKCRELATGKYFWLLSDNEVISDGVLNYVLDILRSDENPGMCFLYGKSDLKTKDEKYSSEQTIFENFILTDKAFLLTLISCVIILNDKTYDDIVFEDYKENSFLGFFFTANALRKNQKIINIYGETFKSIPCNVYFNVFESWTKDINSSLDYMVKSGLLTIELRKIFTTCFLREVIYFHVKNYLIYGELYGNSYGKPTEVKKVLDEYYGSNTFYREKILRLFERSKLSLRMEKYILKLGNKLKKIFSV